MRPIDFLFLFCFIFLIAHPSLVSAGGCNDQQMPLGTYEKPATRTILESETQGSIYQQTTASVHNVGYYEWNESAQLWELTDSSYDPLTDNWLQEEGDIVLPPEFFEDEYLQNTDQNPSHLFESLQDCKEPTLPPVVTVGFVPSGSGTLINGLIIARWLSRGGGLVKPQYKPVTINLPLADCDKKTDDTEMCALIQGYMGGKPVKNNMIFHINYRNNIQSEWVGTGTGYCVRPERLCYTREEND